MRVSSIFAVFVILMLLSGFSFAEHVIDDSQNPQYLLSLASTSGSFEDDTLVLKGVPLVVYFSDRPVRKAGHMSLENLVELWDSGTNNFNDNPPNAELSIYDKKGDMHSVLILSKPELNGDDISFKVKVFHGKIPESFGHSTLFIDPLGMMFPSNQN